MELITVDENEVFKSKSEHRLRHIYFNTLWNDKFNLAVVFIEGFFKYTLCIIIAELTQ